METRATQAPKDHLVSLETLDLLAPKALRARLETLGQMARQGSQAPPATLDLLDLLLVPPQLAVCATTVCVRLKQRGSQQAC